MNQKTQPQDLDVFQADSELAGRFARLSEIYKTEAGLDLADLLPELATMVLDLVEYPVGADPTLSRVVLLSLRISLDHLYPSSVWPDTTAEIGGRFAWAIRAAIAERLGELE